MPYLYRRVEAVESILHNGHADAFEHGPLGCIRFDGEIVHEVVGLALARRVQTNFRGGFGVHNDILRATVQFALVRWTDLYEHTTEERRG